MVTRAPAFASAHVALFVAFLPWRGAGRSDFPRAMFVPLPYKSVPSYQLQYLQECCPIPSRFSHHLPSCGNSERILEARG